MPSQDFIDYSQNTPITASWLNGIDAFVFGSTGNNAVTSPCAWVRFNGTNGAIQQSYGVAGVVRNSAGNYTVNFSQTLAQAANCYNITTNQKGFVSVISETTSSVTVETDNTSGVASDASIVCVQVFGAYTPNY